MFCHLALHWALFSLKITQKIVYVSFSLFNFLKMYSFNMRKRFLVQKNGKCFYKFSIIKYFNKIFLYEIVHDIINFFKSIMGHVVFT